ncbi:MAG: hypothetical protein RJB14_1061 [Pseudomonadota bacterium]
MVRFSSMGEGFVTEGRPVAVMERCASRPPRLPPSTVRQAVDKPLNKPRKARPVWLTSACLIFGQRPYPSALAILWRGTVGLGHGPLGSSNHCRTSASTPTPCMKL